MTSRSKCTVVADPDGQLDLFGPSNADATPLDNSERVWVHLRNSAAYADVTIERIYENGVVVLHHIGRG
jgi:hypothetical protein